MPRGCTTSRVETVNDMQQVVIPNCEEIAERPIVRSVLNDIINGANPMPTPPRLYRNQERKPQWVCNYYPVSDNGRIFIQYVEELCERSVNCSLIELNYDEQKRIVLEAKEIVNLRNALDKIIGDRNG